MARQTASKISMTRLDSLDQFTKIVDSSQDASKAKQEARLDAATRHFAQSNESNTVLHFIQVSHTPGAKRAILAGESTPLNLVLYTVSDKGTRRRRIGKSLIRVNDLENQKMDFFVGDLSAHIHGLSLGAMWQLMKDAMKRHAIALGKNRNRFDDMTHKYASQIEMLTGIAPVFESDDSLVDLE